MLRNNLLKLTPTRVAKTFKTWKS